MPGIMPGVFHAFFYLIIQIFRSSIIICSDEETEAQRSYLAQIPYLETRIGVLPAGSILCFLYSFSSILERILIVNCLKNISPSPTPHPIR